MSPDGMSWECNCESVQENLSQGASTDWAHHLALGLSKCERSGGKIELARARYCQISILRTLAPLGARFPFSYTESPRDLFFLQRPLPSFPIWDAPPFPFNATAPKCFSEWDFFQPMEIYPRVFCVCVCFEHFFPCTLQRRGVNGACCAAAADGKKVKWIA